MPQNITHYLVIKESMKSTTDDLWNNFLNYAVFGSVMPDMFFMHEIQPPNYRGYNYTFLSDIIHWEGTLDLYCSILEIIKRQYRYSNDEFSKLRSFTYGYISHVVSDIIFHPYIYRFSGDHWKFHNDCDKYIDHKNLELQIDCYLANKTESKAPLDFQYQNKIKCFENGSHELDRDLFNILQEAIENIYLSLIRENEYPEIYNKKCINEIVPDFEILDYRNPLYEVYDNYLQRIAGIYSGAASDLMSFFFFKDMRPLGSLTEMQERINMNELHTNWSGSDDTEINHSILELYEMALSAVKRIIAISEEFFYGSSAYPRQFFMNQQHDYTFLQNNFNLDTGLKSRYNGDPFLLDKEKGSRFNFRLKELSKFYQKLDKEKNFSYFMHL